MQTKQGEFGMVLSDGAAQFIETIPRNGTEPILYLADHERLGRVRFNLNGRRFKSQGMRLALVGASGAGKSNAMAVVVEEVHRIGYPLLVFDQEGEFVSLGDLPGVQVFEIEPEQDERACRESCRTACWIADFVLVSGGGVVVDVSELSVSAQRLVFVSLAREFYGRAGEMRRRCFFFVDEASEVAPQRKAKDAVESCRWLEQIVRRGRKRGIYTVLATQRPSALNKDVLAQFNAKLIGRLDIWQDLDAVRPYLTRKVEMKEISGLESGYFLLDLGGESHIVHVRLRMTEDLGGTPLD